MHTADFWWLNGNLFEVEMARVLQETGIIGFILVYAARVWLLIKAVRLGTRFRNPLYVALSGAIACLFLQDVILGFVVNNATVGIYHWFAGGLLFAMYRLEVAELVRTHKRAMHAYGPVAAYANERTKYAVESGELNDSRSVALPGPPVLPMSKTPIIPKSMTQNRALVDVRALFNAKASTWNAKYRSDGPLAFRIAAFRRLLLARLPVNSKVLDLGCGTGTIASALSADGFRVTACDIAEEMVEAGKRIYGESRH